MAPATPSLHMHKRLSFNCVCLFTAVLVITLQGLFSVAESGSYSLDAVLGFPLRWLLLPGATASRVLGLQQLQLPGSTVVVALGLSCCGIFLDQRSNPCFLHCEQIVTTRP